MKKRHFRSAFAASAIALAVTIATTAATPASAQFGGIVYDPTNYSQNILTAARALEQINNQIRSLQNEATSLINEARNLQSLPMNMLEPLQQQIRQTQQLLNNAQGIAYDVKSVESAFARQYQNINLTSSQRAMVQSAEERWQSSVAAFGDALKVQASAVSNIEGARSSLDQLVTASQTATGALQAAQAGNQLLALQSQQLADMTATIASLGRAQSLDAASAAAAKVQAREQLRRFLAPGRGYTPAAAKMFRN